MSQAGRAAHLAQGYPADRSLTIPNGFDLDRFRPDAAAREAIRRELGVDPRATLVGLIGRFHPDKDHRNFIRAAGAIRRQRDDVRFVACGDGVAWSNPQLVAWIDAEGIREACHLLGRRDDMHRVAAALDLNVSSSASEAFSMAIGEAMACEVPSVVTDVGDSAALVGSCGRVVPAGDSRALAAACLDVLSLASVERRQLGTAARQHIAQHFSIDAIAPRYLDVWMQVARRAQIAARPRRDEDAPITRRAA